MARLAWRLYSRATTRLRKGPITTRAARQPALYADPLRGLRDRNRGNGAFNSDDPHPAHPLSMPATF